MGFEIQKLKFKSNILDNEPMNFSDKIWNLHHCATVPFIPFSIYTATETFFLVFWWFTLCFCLLAVYDNRNTTPFGYQQGEIWDSVVVTCAQCFYYRTQTQGNEWMRSKHCSSKCIWGPFHLTLLDISNNCNTGWQIWNCT